MTLKRSGTYEDPEGLRRFTEGGEHILPLSMIVSEGGDSEEFSISGTSAQSSAITSVYADVTPTVDCYVRQGTNPTAVADGTDRKLLADSTVRLGGITSGNKLAFITSGSSGTVSITPG